MPELSQPVKLNGKKLSLSMYPFFRSYCVSRVFTTTWDYGDGILRVAESKADVLVGWFTQSIIGRGARRRYIATHLQTLKTHPLFESVTSVALVSAHPAACHALSKPSREFKSTILNGSLILNSSGEGCRDLGLYSR